MCLKEATQGVLAKFYRPLSSRDNLLHILILLWFAAPECVALFQNWIGTPNSTLVLDMSESGASLNLEFSLRPVLGRVRFTNLNLNQICKPSLRRARSIDLGVIHKSSCEYDPYWGAFRYRVRSWLPVNDRKVFQNRADPEFHTLAI